MMQAALRTPGLALQQSSKFVDEMTRIVTGQSKIAPDPKDKRFEDPAWTTNPVYKGFLQTYLLWRQSLNNLVDHANMPKKDADRARFALSLYTEALAPTNTLLGNPAAMKQLYETGGASAVRGLTHMIEDVARNGGLPSQVNMTACEVGKTLAVSKGAVVFKNEVLELIQYAATSETVYSRPVLAVPPQINKFYIFDLSPGKSLVEYLTQSGFTVFAISWRNPTAQRRDWGLETYMRAILEAVDVVRDITGQETINISAACAGGMTLAVTLGHLAAKGDARLNAATFMVTVLDSSVESTMGLFASKETIAVAKALSKARGVLEGQEMARVFAWLRPNDLVWNYWVNNYLIGKDPAAFDILYWNNDTTRLPSKFHTELLDFSLKNPLTKPSSPKLLGTRLDLSTGSMGTFLTPGSTSAGSRPELAPIHGLGQRPNIAHRPGEAPAPPVLLMNGLGANLELLQPFVDALDPAIEVIRFDVPGVGGSPTPPLPLRFPALAWLAGRMLDALGYKRVDVLGISWGGGLAQQFAMQHPWRCRRLILVSTGTGALMVPGRPKVLAKLATPRRYCDPSYMAAIAPEIYGGAADPALA